MGRLIRHLGASLLMLGCVQQPTHAAARGYLEYGALYNDNYTLAAEPADEQSETIHSLSATLLYSAPVSYKTTLLASGGFSRAWYRRFEDLSNTTLYLNGGIYRRLRYRSAFVGSIGVFRKLYDNVQQDQEGFSVRANFIQQPGQRWWTNQQFFYEQGAARNLTDDYRGYGLSVWLHRRFENGSMLSGAVTGSRKAYDDALNRDFNNYQLLLEWLYPFRKRFYTRLGTAYTLTGSDENYEYRNLIGLFVLGYQFSW